MVSKKVGLVSGLGKTRATNSNWGYSAPNCTYYWSSRCQALVTAAMLNTLGIPPRSTLVGVGWYSISLGSNTYIKSFRIQVGHSALTALTTTWVTSGLQYVYGTAAAGIDLTMANVPIGGYLVLTAMTGTFVWNGTSNLVFDISRTDTTYTGGTTQGYCGVATAPGYGNIFHYVVTDTSTYPQTGTGTAKAWLPDLYLYFETEEGALMGVAI